MRSGIVAHVVPTPERDEKMYDNATKSYEPKTVKGLKSTTDRAAEHAVTVAKAHAERHSLPVLAGRIDLWNGFRSDEINDAVTLLQDAITTHIGPGYMVSFIFYEKPDYTTLTDNDVRDLTFFAFKPSP